MFYMWLPTQPAICNNTPKPSFFYFYYLSYYFKLLLSYFYFNLIESKFYVMSDSIFSYLIVSRMFLQTNQSLYRATPTTGGSVSGSSTVSLYCPCPTDQVTIHCRNFSCSLTSDVASGKETSDGYESLASGGKADGKPRKHHRKSARTRSRQEKTSKPKLSMLNVRPVWNRVFFLCEIPMRLIQVCPNAHTGV